MTRKRDFKKIVRARMLRTGESYTAARARLTRHPAPASSSSQGGSGMYPFERFTERAKRALVLAQQEAETAHHSYIGSEHLLLGLLGVKEGVAATILVRLGVEGQELRKRFEAVLGRNPPSVTIERIAPTSRVKKVIEISFEESRRMGHRYVGTEHLLLGLLVEGESIAAHALREMGVSEERVRAEFDRMMREGRIPPRVAGGQIDVPLSLHLGGLLQRARERALQEGAGVTRVEHLLGALLDEPGYRELAELLDRRQVQWRPPEELRALASRLHEVRRRRLEALQSQQDETAARLLDEEVQLRDQLMSAEHAWLRTIWPEQPPAQA